MMQMLRGSSHASARRNPRILRVEEVSRMRRLIVLAVLTLLCLMLRASARL